MLRASSHRRHRVAVRESRQAAGHVEPNSRQLWNIQLNENGTLRETHSVTTLQADHALTEVPLHGEAVLRLPRLPLV